MHDSGQGDAFAQAMAAHRRADDAVKLEQANKDRIESLERRQAALEKHLDSTEAVDKIIKDEEMIRLHPGLASLPEIPPGYMPHREGNSLVWTRATDA